MFSRSLGPVLDLHLGPPPASPIRSIAGSIATGSQLTELIDAAEAVFYFAGGSTPAGADAGGSVELSVVPATVVLELMRTTATRRIVLASSGGTVYGEPTSFPTPEDHLTVPTGIHGLNALTMERYASFFADRYDMEPVVLRIATAYGPGQRTRRGQGVIAAWIDAALDETPIHAYGSLDTRRDFVFAVDVAESAARTAFDAAPGVYNVGSGTSHALSEVLALLADIAGREFEIVNHPPRGVDVPRTELDCSRLAAEIGWAPSTPLAVGLRATWEWTAALREATAAPQHQL